MDAEFLNLTVNDALLEALTATAIANPGDKIDYLGNYLVQYVSRNRKKREDDKNALITKQIADEANLIEKVKEDAISTEQKQEANRKDNCENVIKIIADTATNKKDAMDTICEVCAEYLKVPAIYIAERTKLDETEYLNYLSANNAQSFMVGKQLVKFTDDSEDKPERQGISFDVFNIPETEEEEEEEEEPEEDEDGQPIPKKEKIPFKLPPLIVENVMRNKNVKFYGIPKLGSVAILPFSYDSTDHDAGCNIEIEIPEPPEEDVKDDAEPTDDNEEGEGNDEEKKDTDDVVVKEPVELKPITKYNENKIKKEFIIAMDTIGNYRIFEQSEIEWLDTVGQKLMSTFERLDKIQFERHVATLQNAQNYEPKISKIINDLETTEAKVIEAIDKRFNIPAANEDGEEDKPADQEDEDGEEKEAAPVDATTTTTKEEETKKEEEVVIELDPETEEPHELLQPYRTAQAIEKLWKNKILSDEAYILILELQTIEIPPPAVILSLFETVAKFLDMPTTTYKNIFNITTWDQIKNVRIIIISYILL